MQTIIDRLRKTSGPVLSACLFALTFGLGLVTFTLSGSVAVAAFVMAVASLASALGARELTTRPDKDQIRSLVQDEHRHVGRRLSEMSERILELEAEIRNSLRDTSPTDQLRLAGFARDIDRISAILQDLVSVVATQDSRISKTDAAPKEQPKFEPKSPLPTIQAPANLSVSLAPKPAKPSLKPANALARLQTENMLREDILAGRLKVKLEDVIRLDTGRVVLRQVQCSLDGRLTEFKSDADLIRGEISPGVIQLFDRMRFGFAFEFASQFSARPDAPPILCPMMAATFAHAEAADEIVDLIVQDEAIAQHLVLGLDHRLFNAADQDAQDRLQRLSQSGATLAAMLIEDFRLDPDILYEAGVRYALADASILIRAKSQMMKSTIHPADLASYLNRHDIELIAETVMTVHDAKTLKTMGIHLASGKAVTSSDFGPVDWSEPMGRFNRGAAREFERRETERVQANQAAPLREHLRRVRM